MIECLEGMKVHFDQQCDRIGGWLDQNQAAYKVVLVANHLFRAGMVFSMLAMSPLPVFVTAGMLLVSSLMYRIAVERFCVFRFTLPSWAGGVAMWLAACNPIGMVALAGYAITIVYISHKDVEERMARLTVGQQRCCP